MYMEALMIKLNQFWFDHAMHHPHQNAYVRANVLNR